MLDPIVTALKDDDDDVRAVAASALLPVAESLVMIAPSYVSSKCNKYIVCRLLLLYAESIQLSSYHKLLYILFLSLSLLFIIIFFSHFFAFTLLLASL